MQVENTKAFDLFKTTFLQVRELHSFTLYELAFKTAEIHSFLSYRGMKFEDYFPQKALFEAVNGSFGVKKFEIEGLSFVSELVV